jgi:Zn-dependent M28 family amino/carboxypeptidase
MRRTFALAVLCMAVLVPSAQAAPNNNTSQKLRDAVTLAEVKTHLANFQAIADAAGGNRFAGLEGHDMSAQYVYDQLLAAGYNPTFQEFEYDAFFERTPSELQRVTAPATTFVNGNDFRVMTYSGSGDVTAPLALPSGDARGCTAADYTGLPAGSIALVQRGTPAGFTDNGGVCTFRLKLDLAAAAGATGILVYNNVDGVVNGTLGATGLSSIPGLGLTKALGEALRAEIVGGTPLTFHMVTNTATERLTTRNVLAETPGGDPNNVVMVGAHLDSVTAGPGINDNGSGSAAILETAEQLAGVKTRNKIRFAWWSGEESGLLGSTYYVSQLTQAQRDAIALYLNFDMVASPNFARFVYDGDNSTNTAPTGTNTPPGSDVIERVFYGYFESVGLAAEPTPFNGRSDYGPFIASGVGIASGGLFTGAENPKTAEQVLRYGGTLGLAYDPCYHAACDTFDNINDTALDTNSDAIAHVVLTFAQSTELINGVRGKGNFKRPRTGTNDGAGTGPGGGGGLHAHEDGATS